MSLNLKPSTALNLTLEGSAGSFSAGNGTGNQSSIEVKYFLTHVGLDFSTGTNTQVLGHLAPVREIFEAKSLEFDELMQRDIDDARVSSELIPYLLDSRSRDLVKLFPPVIVVVLPIKQLENRPDDLYPAVEHFKQMPISGGTDYELMITRSGPVGNEVFQFEQPVQDGRIFEHDLTRLKLNTNRCKLVIVDGQHRAMALLAIYRNLKEEWTDQRRAPFKDFYEEWTPSYIRQFNLEQISLPVMFCTFPRLDRNYKGDSDLKKAARSIFLTLNKTARKVSESRNRLLDDNDLIALFLRDTLSTIKHKDTRSSHSLRIFNVELDQMQDRIKIESPIALTGVNHIYYLVEHFLLNNADADVNGAKPRSGKFSKRKDFGSYNGFTRLGGRDALGVEDANATTRDFYTEEAGKKLTEQFRAAMGNTLIRVFEEFGPFEAHAKAVLGLEQELLSHVNQKLMTILFEGQGIGRVFATHRNNLREKIRLGEFAKDATKIQEIANRLDATATLVEKFIGNLRLMRAELFLNGITDKVKLRVANENEYPPKVVGFINDLYENVFTTVAFQTALICGFFSELERANRQQAAMGLEPIRVSDVFDDYIQNMNGFFQPASSAGFKRLVETFLGRLEGEIRDWQVGESFYTFRQVVYAGEMQPEQWPKYKYLLLEIWRPSLNTLADTVTIERSKCRGQVFNSLHEEYRKEYLRKNLKREETLTLVERKEILNDAYNAFQKFLQNLGWRLSEIPTKNQMIEQPTTGVEDAEVDKNASVDETWQSVEG